MWRSPDLNPVLFTQVSLHQDSVCAEEQRDITVSRCAKLMQADLYRTKTVDLEQMNHTTVDMKLITVCVFIFLFDWDQFVEISFSWPVIIIIVALCTAEHRAGGRLGRGLQDYKAAIWWRQITSFSALIGFNRKFKSPGQIKVLLWAQSARLCVTEEEDRNGKETLNGHWF